MSVRGEVQGSEVAVVELALEGRARLGRRAATNAARTARWAIDVSGAVVSIRAGARWRVSRRCCRRASRGADAEGVLAVARARCQLARRRASRVHGRVELALELRAALVGGEGERRGALSRVSAAGPVLIVVSGATVSTVNVRRRGRRGRRCPAASIARTLRTVCVPSASAASGRGDVQVANGAPSSCALERRGALPQR